MIDMQCRAAMKPERRCGRPLRCLLCLGLLLLLFTSCRRQTDIAKEATITVYGFSVVREPLEQSIFPAYRQQWRENTGQDLNFIGSYAGAEIITNQIISGAEADLAILAVDRQADRLVETRTTRHQWQRLPHGGIVNVSPMVILVRKGNPLRIREFSDLGRRRLRLIHCDPVSSGAGQWSLLAVYGSELMKNGHDAARALAVLRNVWKNVVSTPGSAREARTQFERQEGDALITYELEALQLLAKSKDYEMVVPATTIISEHPVVIINHEKHGMAPARYAVVELFARSLWDRAAQEAWVRAGFRSVSDEGLNERFTKIPNPFHVADLGGWKKAWPMIIEGVWKTQIQQQQAAEGGR